MVITDAVSLRLVHGWLGELRRCGAEVTLFTGSASRLLEGDLACLPGIALRSVPLRRRIAPWSDLRALARLTMAFRRERYEIVHTSTPKAGLVGNLAAWVARAPARVYTVRGLRLETVSGPTRGLMWALEWLSLRLANQRIVISGSLRDELVRLRLVPRGATRVLGAGSSSGVDAGQFRRLEPSGLAPARRRLNIPSRAVVFGFTGRVCEDKGALELLAAWRLLREVVPTAYLVVVGSADEAEARPIGPGVLAALGGDEFVRLGGWQPDTRPFFEALDILVLPSHREGFGNVVLEAACLGVPTLGFRVTGVRDAVQHLRTGILVEREAPLQLVDWGVRLARQAHWRAALGTRANYRARRDFSPERIWDEQVSLYQQALAGGTRRQGRTLAATTSATRATSPSLIDDPLGRQMPRSKM